MQYDAIEPDIEHNPSDQHGEGGDLYRVVVHARTLYTHTSCPSSPYSYSVQSTEYVLMSIDSNTTHSTNQP